MTPFLAIAGFSGSGKTTLLEALLPALAERGCLTAVVKHHPEPLETDAPGKDTWRYRKAGAAASALVGPNLATFYVSLPREEGWLDAATRLFAPFDLVLVEGFKRSSLPKLEVCGEGPPLPTAGVIGRVRAQGASADGLPHFLPDAIDSIADFIDAWRKKQAPSPPGA